MRSVDGGEESAFAFLLLGGRLPLHLHRLTSPKANEYPQIIVLHSLTAWSQRKCPAGRGRISEEVAGSSAEKASLPLEGELRGIIRCK